MASCNDCCRRTPVTTLIGVIFIILGNIMCIIYTCTSISQEEFYKKNIAQEKNASSAIEILPLIFWLLTITLAILVALIAFAGSTESDKEWKNQLKGKKPCLVLLIITFIFIMLWLYIDLIASGMLMNIEIANQSCDDYKYYSKEAHNDSLCISIPFEKDRAKRHLCDSKRIETFCDEYINNMLGDWGLLFLGTDMTVFGLLLCLLCLGLNLSLIRVESTVDLESYGNRRY